MADPFVFALGEGQVIECWDLGVATVKQGEVAKLTLAPEFAYGNAGSPSKIPETAVLVFGVELISRVSQDDLFGDEGVIKSPQKEGSGWKQPRTADEASISLTANVTDGTVIEEKPSLECTLSCGVLGPVATAADEALTGMEEEEVKLTCTKNYAYSEQKPDAAIVELKLAQIDDINDVSLEKDKSMMKKQMGEGEGWDTPKDSTGSRGCGGPGQARLWHGTERRSAQCRKRLTRSSKTKTCSP